MKRCVSCGKSTKEFAEFPCPVCGEMLIRCYSCRKNNTKYKCKCGFTGP